MRQTGLFSRTRKHGPKDETSKNADLLIRAGFIHKEMAGVYSLLPLGLRVMRKIEHIIRTEMMALGGQEVHLSALQEKALWDKTDRWDDAVVDNWFKTQLKNGSELGLATTHEEPLTNLLTSHILSYKDLPVSVFQFQTKFRNELRAKSGMMRGREFLMKDLYSFSVSQEQHAAFYKQVKESYERIFAAVGLGAYTYPVYAAGGSFSKFSMEFQTETEAGEDLIYVDEGKQIGINEEIMSDETCMEFGVKRDQLVQKKMVEVGNIFNLGTRFSEPLGLAYTDESGARLPVIMGCYGIGLGRLMGTIVEVLSDEKGIKWPAAVAPFDVHVLVLGSETNDMLDQKAEGLYRKLREAGKDVLLDDRSVSAGEKFADADLIGIPFQIVIGKKSLESGQYEVRNRQTGEVSMVNEDDLIASL